MNNDYKWETIGRCKFYTDGTTCTDIEVIDDAKEISFIYPKIMINRERCQKVFSSVEVMLIGRNVISIVIPNKMFPNIILSMLSLNQTALSTVNTLLKELAVSY